jgi:hypothetical protein
MTAGTSTTTIKLNMLFTPDVAGTYTILLWANANAYTAGLPSAVVTVTTAGTPTSATLSTWASSFTATAAATSTTGALVKVTLKDAAGNATIPTSAESIDLSIQGAADITTTGIGGSAQTATSVAGYTDTDFKYGSIFKNVANTAAETITLKVIGSGVLTGNGLAASVSLTSKAAADIAAAAAVVPDAEVATAANTGGFTAATGSTTKTSLTSIPLEFAVPAALTATTAAYYYGYRLTDSFGLLTGNVGSVYSPYATGAVGDTEIQFSVSASLLNGTSFIAAAWDVTTISSATLTVSGETKAAFAVANGTPSVVQSSVGGTVTLTSQVTDQYGSGIANVPVVVSISGRNAATTISSSKVSDASGYVSFSYTDAGTATSTSVVDTVTFTASSASSDTTGTATINFGTVTVGTVTVTGAASADVAPSVTYTNIATDVDGPHASAVAITATVKDANANLLAGVPVTFAVSGNTGSAIKKTSTTDYTTVYTGSTGTAVTYVLGWTNGATTVTATAGGKSGTGKINFLSGTTAANATDNARVLSGTVSGNILSYKVVDRFGNPVPYVSISLSRTGSGLFGGGASTQTLTTDEAGTADVSFVGAGTVKAKLAADYYQAYDVVGEVDVEATTAATAGTTVGTGASFAPAGVSTVSLDVAAGSDSSTTAATAAADAAAEATDAANAATDAANAAAEAADAATAAAQDAADAVAALSAQVATLISGLKSQLTALTNLVIKIQKKVKA